MMFALFFVLVYNVVIDLFIDFVGPAYQKSAIVYLSGNLIKYCTFGCQTSSSGRNGKEDSNGLSYKFTRTLPGRFRFNEGAIRRADLSKQESGRAQAPGDSNNQYPDGIVLVPFTEELVDQSRLGSLCALLGGITDGFEDLLVDRHHFSVVNELNVTAGDLRLTYYERVRKG